MQLINFALPLALAGGALANPLLARGAAACTSDACCAAVTGSAALGDAGLRASHCASYLATTVTPPAVTITATITGAQSSGWNAWKRAQVTVCPNEVPNYASACNDAAYSSACSCFGYTETLTTTVAPTTTTKTIWVKPTGAASSCSVSTITAATTVTVTVAASTSSSTPASKCNVNDALATKLVNNFATLLEYTSYAGSQGAPGRGYKYDVSAATLNPAFTDISDSINFMAGFPLGSVTFGSKAAFDYGQGTLQPEVTVNTLNIWHDCNSITWRWRIVSTPYPVNGINHMIVGDDGLLIKNYAEFDNGAWLESFGQKCAVSNVTVAASPALRA